MSETLKSYIADYLRDHIPLATAMGVKVLEADRNRIVLRAPLAPNVNHRGTVFGGSAASVATLAAWGLLRLRMIGVDVDAHLVIQHSRMHYLRPMAAEFLAICQFDDEASWCRACRLLARRGKARVSLHCTLQCEGTEAARFEGEFVVIRVDEPRPDPAPG